jgi:hypothetical protein
MSKQNNINPGNYYDGDRNHQGEGIVHDEQKRTLKEELARDHQGKPGQPNFIPGEKPVGESSNDE